MSIVPRASYSDDSRMTKKQLPKALLLRDYLLDDMSSCSSNGFRSYPRRQCCTTVRFLMDVDLNRNYKPSPNQPRRLIVESKSKWKLNLKSRQSSMLQRASTVMINAFKHFPFAGTGSLSRKLLKHGFWKKSVHHNTEVKRLISLEDLIKESEISVPSSPPRFSTAVTTSTTPELNRLASNSDGNSNNNSWSGNDSTVTTDSFTASNSSEINLAQNDVVNDLPENKKTTNGNRVGATTVTATATNYCDNSTENAKKKWQNEEDEQSSPVSVMDFPNDDHNDNDDDEVSSMFQYRHLEVEGTKKLTNKSRRFECVTQLEPVKLEDRIAQSVINSSTQTCFAQEENQPEKKAMALLQLMKSTLFSNHLLKDEAVESLLLAFFKQRLIEKNCSDYEILWIAKDWMDGNLQAITLDWESENNRQTYVREMDKTEKWLKYDDEVVKEHVGFELERDIFNSLVDDILLDFVTLN